MSLYILRRVISLRRAKFPTIESDREIILDNNTVELIVAGVCINIERFREVGEMK